MVEEESGITSSCEGHEEGEEEIDDLNGEDAYR